MDIKEKQNIADSVGSDSLQSDRQNKIPVKENESLSKSLKDKIEELELKKQKSMSRRKSKGLKINAKSPKKEGQGSPNPGSSSFLPSISPSKSGSFLPDISPTGRTPSRLPKPDFKINKLTSDGQLESLENINDV